MFEPNFEANSHVTSILGPENRPKSLAQKAVSFKNGLSTAKKYFTRLDLCLNILFYSYQPTFGYDEAFSFFHFFPFLFLVSS